MNARSLQSVLVLLAQILGPFGQTWVFHKFGWVLHKFTENGEFFNRWFLLLRDNNRDACSWQKQQWKYVFNCLEICRWAIAECSLTIGGLKCIKKLKNIHSIQPDHSQSVYIAKQFLFILYFRLPTYSGPRITTLKSFWCLFGSPKIK